MIKYRWFAADECPEGYNDTVCSAIDIQLMKAKKTSRNYKSNDPLCILALDNDKVAGRINMTYGHISDNGQLIRVAAMQGLFANPDYRGQGIGTNLITNSLQIGMPCIYSGISAQAMPLFKRLGFVFIDRAPIFQIPLGFAGAIKEWRARLYRLEESDYTGSSSLGSLGETLKVLNDTLRRTAEWSMLTGTDALSCIEEMTEKHYRRFQIPWNIKMLSLALEDRHPKLCAAIFARANGPGIERHLVTVYRKNSKVRFPLTFRKIEFSNGQLNEIFPPPKDIDSALTLLRSIAVKAKVWGFKNLEVYAMTNSIQGACEILNLNTYGNKSVSIQPLSLFKNLAAEMINTENWWCRAINEDQIEEAI